MPYSITEVYTYSPAKLFFTPEQCEEIHKGIAEVVRFLVAFDDSIWYDILKEYGMEVIRR